MNHHRRVAVFIVALILSLAPSRVYGDAGAPAPPVQTTRVSACKLVSKEEVKKILPWEAMFDQMPVEEEPIGTTGSSCNYPSATIQVLAYTPAFFDRVKKLGKLEPVPGLGDEAYFFADPRGYADVYVKAGNRIVTVQGTPGPKQKVEALKPGVTALAKLLVSKLR